MRRLYVCLVSLGLLSSALAVTGSAVQAIGVDTTKAAIPVEAISSGGPPPQGIPALGFTGDRAGLRGRALRLNM